MNDALLDRKAAAAYIVSLGVPCSPATLATKATRGGGPPYQLFGKKPLYRKSGLDEWVNSKLSKLITSSSELK